MQHWLTEKQKWGLRSSTGGRDTALVRGRDTLGRREAVLAAEMQHWLNTSCKVQHWLQRSAEIKHWLDMQHWQEIKHGLEIQHELEMQQTTEM